MTAIDPHEDKLTPESQSPKWTNVRLIYCREMLDQLRDRRTLFTIVLLPIVLYPLVGTLLLQIAQFSRQYPNIVCVVGGETLGEDLPDLFVGDGFAAELSNPEHAIDLARHQWNEFSSPEDLKSKSHDWIRNSVYDVVVVIPPTVFDASPADGVGDVSKASGLIAPQWELLYNVASDQSMLARDRVTGILASWRDRWVSMRLESRQIDAELLHPFSLNFLDIAPSSVREAAFWSKVLPFVMLVWAMTGAFYPAVDLVAGEKERGTLETLLCSSALRGEIVWGKLLAVTTFSMLTAILNVGSMLVTSSLVFRQMAISQTGTFASPPLVPLMWLVVALVPLSALFSALALAVAAMAKSSKEGQYYLMPLMMVSLPLVLLPMMPGTTLSMGTSLIPVTGMFLLVRSLVEGQYASALMHLPMVAGVTMLALGLAARWARRQFESEAVLFAGGEQWQLSRWARTIWEDRRLTASPAQAYFAAGVILIGLFFGKLIVTSMPDDFAGIVRMVLVPQIGLILTPTLLIAMICTRSVRKSLRLTAPTSWASLPIALLLGIVIHPAYVMLAGWIHAIYPISQAATDSLKPFAQTVADAPWLYVVLLMAVLPAICEELAYRGFIFGGLVCGASPLRAVLVTSVVFGVSHSVLQQSIAATTMGMLLGYVCLRSGSVFPSMIIHVVVNSFSLMISRVDQWEFPGLSLFVRTSIEGVEYQPMWVVIASCIALCTVMYFALMDYRDECEIACPVQGNASPLGLST